jgi:ABC-type nitrate/sulfonate/bicarbonate transport system substrate-binding protein
MLASMHLPRMAPIAACLLLAGCTAAVQEQAAAPDIDLNRPLIVGIAAWPGHAPGLVANRGAGENPDSTFLSEHGLAVRFRVIEDETNRFTALAKGGPEGVDVLWTSIDQWAEEMPEYLREGIDAKAFLQTGWSRGGDVLVVDAAIKRLEDLNGKEIGVLPKSSGQWFMERLLDEAGLNETAKRQTRGQIVFSNDPARLRNLFYRHRIYGVMARGTEIDLALRKRGSHVLATTAAHPVLIADMFVARSAFLREHPKAMEAFARGWIDGAIQAEANPDLAATMLEGSISLFKKMGHQKTKASLGWVGFADLDDNARMFGLDGQPSLFDALFGQASDAWVGIGRMDSGVSPETARDASVIRRIVGDAE